LALSWEGALEIQNYPSHHQGNWHFAEVSGMHHTQRHSAKVPEEMISAWSRIHSITDQSINQWRNHLNVRAKANTLNICCVIMINACITVVMNRLTHVVFHKVM